MAARLFYEGTFRPGRRLNREENRRGSIYEAVFGAAVGAGLRPGALCLFGTAGRDDIAAEAAGAKDWGIVLSAKDVTPVGMTLVISQSGGEVSGQLEYGEAFALETLADGAWEAVPYAVPGDSVAWQAIAYLLPPDKESEMEISWEYLYGSLPAGNYRLSKEFTDFRESGTMTPRLTRSSLR